ncbi:MAG: M48 family metallopeptidase [bacterium]
MNFFEYQEAARRQTSRLIAFYMLAVILIILTLYFVTALIFHYDTAMAPDQPVNWIALWDPPMLGLVALITSVIIAAGSLYKIASLSSGGEAVATMLDGRPIAPDTTDFHERRLLNVVEEMAIASGTPIPRVFIMDQEEGINAFAAGFTTKDAVIAITRGALMSLNREELQGVIGHEFSHILNGDMRLNIRLIGILHGILLIALVGYFMFRILGRSGVGGGSRDKKGNPLAVLVLLGLAMMIIGYIGVFFARLIKSAVSRQREFLADASSVQFTRNPTGLSGALKKIGGLVTGSRLAAPSAEAASHLFFANGIASPFLGMLATHPPLKERIRRLDPHFTGDITQSANTDTDATVSHLTATPVQPPSLPIPGVSPAQIVAQTGTLSPLSLIRASTLLDAIPASLRTAAHTPLQAQLVIYALLLDAKPDLRQRQLDYLAGRLSPELKFGMDTLAADLKAIPAKSRQPIAELAVGSLKHLSPSQYPAFRETIMELVAADSEVSLFEYMILRMVLRNLDTQFGLATPSKRPITSLNPLMTEIATVMSTLAWFGTSTPTTAEQAFQAGCRELGDLKLRLLPQESASLDHLDKALDRLAGTTPPLKQKLVAACAAAVIADGTITLEEGEALRAIADALDCPLPPLT